MLAKKEALQNMSKSIKEDSRKPMSDELKAKKLQKVTVMAPDEEGLEKGLSKAQEILKAKFGKLGLDEDEMEDMDEHMENCPICGAEEECEHCEPEEMEEVE